jgi:TolB protein
MVTSRMRAAGVLCLVLLTHCATEPSGNGGNGASTEILFTRFADVNIPDADIYIVGSDGTGLRPLLTGPSSDFSPDWSPDGQRIAFGSYGRTTGEGLYVMNRDGGDMQLVSSLFSATGPDWSPDGLQIAFAAGGLESIYLVDADGSGERVLAPSEQIDAFFDVRLFHPTWSPDGARVAFGAWVLGHAGGSFSVWAVNADGTELGLLPLGAAGELYLQAPAWSPDGESIAFVCSTGRFSTLDICLVPSGGGTPTVLTGAGEDRAPTWSPNGRELAFVRSVDGSDDALMVVGVDGGTPRVVATAPNIHGISWGPAP